MSEERGVILFSCSWEQTTSLTMNENLDRLVYWRNRLAACEMIGVDSSGTGFGNLSIRCGPGTNEFVITGSQTGNVGEATGAILSHVTEFDVEENSLSCRGPVKASSESLTHGMLYRLHDCIGAVAHVHHRRMWEVYMKCLPATRVDIAAGTPDMAREIERVLNVTPATGRHPSAIVMSGHTSGLLAFGPNIACCGRLLLEMLGQVQESLKE